MSMQHCARRHMICQWQSARDIDVKTKHNLMEAAHIQGHIDRFEPMSSDNLTGQAVTGQQATLMI